MKLKRLLGALKRTISGENKTGEAIHGVLDLFPIPNQVIAKGAKALFGGDRKKAKEEFSKLLTVRNGIALVASVLYLTGMVTMEDIKAIIELLAELGVG